MSMSVVLRLVRIQLKSQFASLSPSRLSNMGGKEVFKFYSIIVAIVISIAYGAGVYGFIAYKMYEASSYMGVPELIITLGGISAGLSILLFGIFHIISSLFYARDIQFLSSLPVSGRSVFTSKLIIVMMMELPAAIVLLGIPVAIYGVMEKSGAAYWIISAACLLTVPVIPIAISSITCLFLMNLLVRVKHRSAFATVGGFALFFGIMLLNNAISSSLAGGSEKEIMMRLVENVKAMVEIASSAYVPSLWLTNAIAGIDLMSFGLLIAVSAASLGISLAIAGRIYGRSLTSSLESSASRVSGKWRYRQRPPSVSLFMVQWKEILRTPVYAINSLFGIPMGIVFALMPVMGMDLASDPDIRPLVEAFGSADGELVIFLAILALLAFVSAINPAGATTVSREGRAIWIMKSIPQPYRVQMVSKLLFAFSVPLLATIPTCIVIGAVYRVSGWVVLMAAVSSLSMSFLVASIAVAIDMTRPKLDWDNPQEVIKQSVNVLLQLLTDFVAIASFGALCYYLVRRGWGFFAISACISAISSALSIAAVKMTLGMAGEKLGRVEG